MSEQKSVNRVFLVGNVVADAEMRFVPTHDVDVASFAIATNEAFKDKNSGQWKETTEFHNCVAWAGLAKKAERIVKKGNVISVDGMIRTERYTDKEGTERKATKIRVRDLTLILDRQKLREPREDAAVTQSKDDNILFPDDKKIDDFKRTMLERVPEEFPYDDSEGKPF